MKKVPRLVRDEEATETGIYYSPPRVWTDDPAEIATLFDAHNRRYDLDARLDEAEQYAKAVLEAYRQPLVRNKKGRITSFGGARASSKRDGTPANAKQQIEEANRLKGEVSAARAAVKQGNVRLAAIHTYWVGRTFEALRVRQEEPHAKRGKGTLSAARAGGRNRATDPQTVKAWKSRAKALRQETPTLSDLSAAFIIANETGGKAETIRKKIKRTR
jgi:hypothetical protein